MSLDAGEKELEEVLEFYDAYDWMEYANHVMWLSAVQDALGFIPFELDYFTILALTVLKDEIAKKGAQDSYEMRQKQQGASRGGGNNRAVGLDKAIIG